MSDSGDIQPYDWFKKFFGGTGRNYFGRDMFREFDDMQREMQRMFDQFSNIHSTAPKELVREYDTPEGGKAREVGPIVYGYSVTIGPDGKPHVREFGNVKPSGNRGGGTNTAAADGSGPRSQITAEREPLVDVNVTEKEVIVILEMPGVKKENIRVTAAEGLVEVMSDDPARKYRRTVELPEGVDIETARSKYNNGILEVTFNKKKQTIPKGKEVKVE
jgi:HSP20 family protein